eukprot:Opistho-2@65513
MSCIGSEFNRINAMRCPYCTVAEPSQWTCAMARPHSTRPGSVPRTVTPAFGTKDIEAGICTQCGDDFRRGWRRSTVRLRCRHEFHFECAGTYFNSKGRMECPMCHRIDSTGVWAYMLAPDGRRVTSRNFPADNASNSDDENEAAPLVAQDPPREFFALYRRAWSNVWRGKVRSEYLAPRLLGLLCMLAVASMVVFAGTGRSSPFRVENVRPALGLTRDIVENIVGNVSAQGPAQQDGLGFVEPDGSRTQACCTFTTESIAAIVASVVSAFVVFLTLPALLLCFGPPLFIGVAVWRYYHELFIWSSYEMAIEGAAVGFCLIGWLLYLYVSGDGFGLLRRPRQSLRLVYGV